MYAKIYIPNREDLFPLLFQALTLSFSLVARRFAIEVSHTLAPRGRPYRADRAKFAREPLGYKFALCIHSVLNIVTFKSPCAW